MDYDVSVNNIQLKSSFEISMADFGRELTAAVVFEAWVCGGGEDCLEGY